jgi:hypothetical protein
MFQSDEEMFHNLSHPRLFNNINVTETISNLSTTKLEHQIRIILIVQNQSFTNELKTLTARKTLEAIFIDHTSINLMWNPPGRENVTYYIIEYEVGKKKLYFLGKSKTVLVFYIQYA